MMPYTLTSFSVSSLSVTQTKRLFAQNQYISATEKQRKKQLLSLAGNIALKKSVQKLLTNHTKRTLAMRHISIDNDLYGKPFVVNYPLQVSMSHSDGEAIAVATFSDDTKGIGIDREYVRIFDTKIVSAFLNDKERCWCEEDPINKNRRETLCWSYKESFLKAIGVGLRIHPKNVILVPHSEKNVLLQYENYQAIGKEIPSYKKDHITTLVTIL